MTTPPVAAPAPPSSPGRSRRWLVLLALAGALLLAFALRYPLTLANLPVAVHIDERTMLEVLHRLRFESLNPEFFAYPSLFFYINHFLFRFLPFAEMLWLGRVLNLLLSCLLGLGSYFLGAHLLRSRPAGLIAAMLTLFSPILIRNAAYLNTDILFTAMTVFALLFWGRFFQQTRYRDWALGLLFTGLAVGSKYTAGLALLSYLVLEFVWEPYLTASVQAANTPGRWLNARIPHRLFLLLVVVGGFVALAAFLIPEDLFFSILETGAGVNSIIDASDLAFIDAMRRRMVLVAAGALVFAILCWRWPALARRFTTLRPYAAVAGVALVFLCTTPFALLDARLFLYDVGFILKTSFGGGGDLGSQYLTWFRQADSLLVLALGLVGVVAAVRLRLRPVALLLLYLLLSLASILTAAVGFIRYLTPLLPVLYAFTGLALVVLWGWVARRQRFLATALVGALLLVIALDVWPAARPYLGRVPQPNVFYDSYTLVADDIQPDHVFFAGYAPGFELEQAGYLVTEIALREIAAGRFVDRLRPGDVLILTAEANDLLPLELQQQFTLLWSGNQFPQQFVYQRR